MSDVWHLSGVGYVPSVVAEILTLIQFYCGRCFKTETFMICSGAASWRNEANLYFPNLLFP
jgi:hypothetical protein